MICRHNSYGLCIHCGHKPERLPFFRNCPTLLDGKHPGEFLPKPKPEGIGPGSELKTMLGRIGISSTPDCQCNARAIHMDQMGCDWCESNIAAITGWLREEATKRGLPFVDMAARLLVRRAIANARKAEARRAKEAEAAAAEGRAAV
jgi:hypothetical protein